MTKDKVKK